MEYCEVLDNIDLQLVDRPDESTLCGGHNDVFFTREHLAAGLRFPVPSIDKKIFILPERPDPYPPQRDSYPNR